MVCCCIVLYCCYLLPLIICREYVEFSSSSQARIRHELLVNHTLSLNTLKQSCCAFTPPTTLRPITDPQIDDSVSQSCTTLLRLSMHRSDVFLRKLMRYTDDGML